MRRERPAPNRAAQGGFTLLEIMIALGILAFALAVITSASSASSVYGRRVYRSTTAALLLRGTVLDIEEEYRKDGFPTNDVEGRDCELPKPFDRMFDCEYDLIGLNLDESMIQSMTGDAQDVVAASQESLAESGALDQLSNPDGKKPSRDDLAVGGLDDAGGKANQLGDDFAQLAQGGNIMQLLQVIMTNPAAGGLLGLCDINVSVLMMSMNLMVGELLPLVLKRAADRTRKIRVRLSWRGSDGETEQLEIETFTTALSEEEAEQMKALLAQQQLQQAAGQGPGGAGAGGGANPLGGRGVGGPGGMGSVGSPIPGLGLFGPTGGLGAFGAGGGGGR